MLICVWLVRWLGGQCSQSSDARAAWQWLNFCRGKVQQGKAALRINLGGTSVCLFQRGQKGNILVSSKRLREGLLQKVNSNRARCCLTHVGVICDRPDMQPKMPQVAIGNERAFLAGDVMALASVACVFAGAPVIGPSVRVIRLSSSCETSGGLLTFIASLSFLRGCFLVVSSV